MATVDQNVPGDFCYSRVGGGSRKNVAKKRWLLPEIYPKLKDAEVLQFYFSHQSWSAEVWTVGLGAPS